MSRFKPRRRKRPPKQPSAEELLETAIDILYFVAEDMGVHELGGVIDLTHGDRLTGESLVFNFMLGVDHDEAEAALAAMKLACNEVTGREPTLLPQKPTAEA